MSKWSAYNVTPSYYLHSLWHHGAGTSLAALQSASDTYTITEAICRVTFFFQRQSLRFA